VPFFVRGEKFSRLPPVRVTLYMMERHPIPAEIRLHTESHTLEVVFDSGASFDLPWEYLRVFSPSAEVRGRRGKDRLLVVGKEDVVVTRIEPVGNYAVKIFFDDGHKTGIYDWRYLHELGENRDRNWKDHLARVAAESAPGSPE